jgi:hypothetical protein
MPPVMVVDLDVMLKGIHFHHGSDLEEWFPKRFLPSCTPGMGSNADSAPTRLPIRCDTDEVSLLRPNGPVLVDPAASARSSPAGGCCQGLDGAPPFLQNSIPVSQL